VRGFVANTDFDWYSFLKARSPLDEVNFWQPGGSTRFSAVPVGAPFFFRLKRPHNAIAGFGVFAGASLLPSWLAWESFGEKNGAPDFREMTRRIDRYRAAERRDPHGQYTIGCLMISQPVFFEHDRWVADPADWSPQIVQGKGYDVTIGEGRRIYAECIERAREVTTATGGTELQTAAMPDAPRYGEGTIVRPRLGQGTFRIAVTEAYTRACAVTGEHSLPALEAAHIKPYAEGGAHEVSNGLLLRSDIHRLFDRGYVTVTGDLRFEVSRKLREDFENGRSYYPLRGNALHVPQGTRDRPDAAMIEWHNENVFLG
jgi:putative restriction endonuclease